LVIRSETPSTNQLTVLVPSPRLLSPVKQSSAPPGNRRGESDATSLMHQPSVVGDNEGAGEGEAVGSTVGFRVGFTLGSLDGALVGSNVVGVSVGTNEGTKDGSFDGNRVGIAEGANVSTMSGVVEMEGDIVGFVGVGE